MNEDIIFYAILGMLIIGAVGSAVYVWNQEPTQLSPGSGEMIPAFGCVCNQAFLSISPQGVISCEISNLLDFSC